MHFLKLLISHNYNSRKLKQLQTVYSVEDTVFIVTVAMMCAAAAAFIIYIILMEHDIILVIEAGKFDCCIVMLNST